MNQISTKFSILSGKPLPYSQWENPCPIPNGKTSALFPKELSVPLKKLSDIFPLCSLSNSEKSTGMDLLIMCFVEFLANILDFGSNHKRYKRID